MSESNPNSEIDSDILINEVNKKKLHYEAITKMQCMVRIHQAKKLVKFKSSDAWHRVFDPKFKIYFWYNRFNGQSQWNLPIFLTLFKNQDITAAIDIGRIVRGFIYRMRARKKAHSIFTRFYDSNLDKFYWMINSTKQTFWNSSKWLIKQDIPMPPEDQMLYKSQLKIKELEKKLLEKEKEIVEVRFKRYEELEPEVLKDRVKNAKLLNRSKNMDEWSIDELAAWLTELKMEQYIPFMYSNRVDGNLFINLTEDDWVDVGIVNKFLIRKLQIILKSYRTRYQRKLDDSEVDEEDDLLSEYAPSELSDIIAAEDGDNLVETDEDKPDEAADSDSSEPDSRTLRLTDEQTAAQRLDSANVQIDTSVPGDGSNFPIVADIVRVRYAVLLKGGGKVVSSSKTSMQRSHVEFVLGIDQIIKGLDYALPLMSIGQRAKISISAAYAYGKEGLPPVIPPDTDIVMDLTLLGFRPRPVWMKPLIQKPGLSEKPY